MEQLKDHDLINLLTYATTYKVPQPKDNPRAKRKQRPGNIGLAIGGLTASYQRKWIIELSFFVSELVLKIHPIAYTRHVSGHAIMICHVTNGQ